MPNADIAAAARRVATDIRSGAIKADWLLTAAAHADLLELLPTLEDIAAKRQLPREKTLTPWDRAAVSARAGLCMCHACVNHRNELPVTLNVCPKCGNKRCPKAEDHRFRCSGSNELCQVGVLEETDVEHN